MSLVVCLSFGWIPPKCRLTDGPTDAQSDRIPHQPRHPVITAAPKRHPSPPNNKRVPLTCFVSTDQAISVSACDFKFRFSSDSSPCCWNVHHQLSSRSPDSSTLHHARAREGLTMTTLRSRLGISHRWWTDAEQCCFMAKEMRGCSGGWVPP